MNGDTERPVRWSDDLLHFLAWAVSMVFVGANFIVARGLVQAVLARIGAALPYEYHRMRREAGLAPFDRVAFAIMQVATVVLALASLAVVMYVERYLSRGADEHRLFRAIRRTFITLIVSGISMYAITLLLYTL